MAILNLRNMYISEILWKFYTKADFKDAMIVLFVIMRTCDLFTIMLSHYSFYNGHKR